MGNPDGNRDELATSSGRRVSPLVLVARFQVWALQASLAGSRIAELFDMARERAQLKQPVGIPEQGREARRGIKPWRHSQSTAPSRPTSAAACESPIKP